MNNQERAGISELRMVTEHNRHVRLEMLLVVIATGGLCAILSVMIEKLSGFPAMVPLLLLAVIGAFSVERIGSYHPHDRLGWANITTFLRGGIIVLFAAPLFAEPSVPLTVSESWVAAGLAMLAFALDGVDGYLARKQGLVSDFGARLDMELDALFILLLSALAYLNGKAGIWVLSLGLMRYAYQVAMLVIPALKRELPPSLRRKAVCVLQITVLIVLLVPFVSGWIATLLALVALGTLLWSFARDIIWQLTNTAP